MGDHEVIVIFLLTVVQEDILLLEKKSNEISLHSLNQNNIVTLFPIVKVCSP